LTILKEIWWLRKLRVVESIQSMRSVPANIVLDELKFGVVEPLQEGIGYEFYYFRNDKKHFIAVDNSSVLVAVTQEQYNSFSRRSIKVSPCVFRNMRIFEAIFWAVLMAIATRRIVCGRMSKNHKKVLDFFEKCVRIQ